MDGTATIILEAELTIVQVGVWFARLTDEAVTDDEVVIDASQLERVDAAGLQLLLAFKRCCAEKNVAVSLFNVPKNLQELIQVTGLSQELA